MMELMASEGAREFDAGEQRGWIESMRARETGERVRVQVVVTDDQADALTAASSHKQRLEDKRMQFGSGAKQHEDFRWNGNGFGIEDGKVRGLGSIFCCHALRIPHA